VAAHSEQILDGSMERKKPLGVTRRFESSHLSFPLAGWLMRDFRSIVGIPFHAVSHVAEDASHGGGVASQFVSDDLHWFGALATQQSSKESLCGALIPMRLNQDIDHVSVLIHRPPQILLSPVDSNEHLIQVPMVAESSFSSLSLRA